MPHVEITDRYGRRRRARPGEMPADGETLHFPMTIQDGDVRDGFGMPGGHRRGFAFPDNCSLRDAADQAYEERNERLQNAWRQNRGSPSQQQQQQRQQQGIEHVHNVGDAQALADRAYEIKKQTLSNAWRKR